MHRMVKKRNKILNIGVSLFRKIYFSHTGKIRFYLINVGTQYGKKTSTTRNQDGLQKAYYARGFNQA